MNLLSQNKKIKCYRVGGSVRDEILGIQSTDNDWLVTGATPQDMMDAGFQAVGKDFPVFLHPKTHEEYALARCEKKIAKGYQGFQFYTSPDISVEEDLLRRDLTINAMAMDSKGELIDPYNGAKDCTNRVLRHVSDAFTEDPLRVLRVAKFYARFHHLGFTIAPETMKLMTNISLSDELEALSSERIWQETEAALADQTPSHYFYALKECGALEKLFPAIYHLFGKPQPSQYHPEIDSGIHAMMVLDRACELSDKMSVRFAALCHDLGKSDTPENILPSHRGHEARGVKHVDALSRQYPIGKTLVQFAKKVCRYHTHMHRLNELTPKKILEVLEAFNAFHAENTVEEYATVCQSDAQGRLGFETTPYPQFNTLIELQRACQRIKARDYIDDFQGIKLKNKLEKERCIAMTQYRNSKKPTD